MLSSCAWDLREKESKVSGVASRERFLAASKGNLYKYLGIEQVFEPDSTLVKGRLEKTYLMEDLVLRTERQT